MTEQSSGDKHIKCSRCGCKYHNHDDTIKSDFGHNRFGERLKTCDKCRESSRAYQKAYGQEQRAEMKLNTEIEKEKLNTSVEENNKYCTRCRKSKPANDYVGATWTVNDKDEYEDVIVKYKTCGECRFKNKDRRW